MPADAVLDDLRKVADGRVRPAGEDGAVHGVPARYVATPTSTDGTAELLRVARALIDAFTAEGVEYVIVNAASCGSAMKEYADLLADDPAYAPRATAFARRVRDLFELLVELGPVAVRHPLPMVAAYQDACHLAHAQGVRSQPRQLLRDIPGLQLREIAEPEICCGSAGIWNVLNPEPGRELGDRKAAAGADVLVTANPGCLMQIASAMRRGGGAIALAHTAEVLDASLRAAPIRGAPSRRAPRPQGE